MPWILSQNNAFLGQLVLYIYDSPIYYGDGIVYPFHTESVNNMRYLILCQLTQHN